jgi:hypothetical protein
MRHLTYTPTFISGPGPCPGVPDLYGSAGGLFEHRAALLASHGFVTFHLAYFDYDDLPKNMVDINFDYFKVSVSLIAIHPITNYVVVLLVVVVVIYKALLHKKN